MESPKDATKKAKLHSKLYLEVKTQAISFKTQEKTQNSRIKLKNSASHYSLVAEKWPKNKPDVYLIDFTVFAQELMIY